jgi:pimeloyl-ACP methyl ester carboxylesterase
MGHSMGGVVASVATSMHPKVFRGLVVIDPPYWRTKAFWADMLPKWDELQNGFLFVTMAFGNQLPPDMPPWMMTWYGIRGQAMAEHVVGTSLQGAYAPDMLGQQEAHTELVKSRTVPRLAVYMREENVENEKRLGVGEKDEIVHFPDAGHWLHHMKPDQFNAILIAWLEKIELS